MRVDQGDSPKRLSLSIVSKVSRCRMIHIMTQPTSEESPGINSRIFLFNGKLSSLDKRVISVT